MLTKFISDKDAEAFLQLIDDSENIVMTCHVRPDGDALGSTLGFYHLLMRMGKNAKVVIPDKAPKSLAFVPGAKELVAYSQYKEFAETLIQNADLIICCDFNKASRLDQLADIILNASCKKVLVDHHLDPDNFTDLTFSFDKMSSASELTFRLIAAMGLLEMMDKDCATAICTGIVTDTRNLSVNCEYSDLYIIMYELIKKGVDKRRIVKEALETKTYNSVKLCAYAMSEKLTIFEQHQGAVIVLDKSELDRFNYEKGDSEGLVNQALEIKGITYSFFLREDPDCIKVSARSVNNFPVNQICEDLFNGGGHIQAAGGEFYGTLEECQKILINAMPNYDKYLTHKHK